MGRSRRSVGRAAAFALTGLLLAGCGQTTVTPTPTSTGVSPTNVPAVSASAYFLPAPAGTTLVATNANQDSADHAPGQPGQWAWDFGVAGNAPFTVMAARGGAVIGARGDSTVQCKNANTLIDGTADPNCWTQANYVLIDQGDGASGLYMHLSSAAVSVGDQVCRGQAIGVDGETGWATGPHVHFQVEATPAARSGSGWWFAESLKGVRFSDPDVLRQNADGVPVRGSYVSANVATCQAPVATPTPTPNPTLAPALGGTWVAPADGTTVKTSALTLTAKPTTSLTDVNLTKVVFTMAWGTASPVTACTATVAGSGGAWSCKADLFKLGAPLGPLVLGFDVFDDAGDVAHSPDGTRTVTLAAPPPAPTGVKFTGQDFRDWPCDATTCYAKVSLTWGPVPAVSGYRIYGQPYAVVSGGCAGRPEKFKPVAARTLLATLGGTASKWSGTVNLDGFGTAYYSIDLVDFNAAGTSTTHAGDLWQPGFC
jgi:murein DD-endopeptidase MepM/ murein hydrolase activator NlpD